MTVARGQNLSPAPGGAHIILHNKRLSTSELRRMWRRWYFNTDSSANFIYTQHEKPLDADPFTVLLLPDAINSNC
jgi:hypothetical protein